MSEEIDLVDYIKVILRRKWVILGVTVFSVIIGMALSWRSAQSYKTETILEIGQFEINKVKEFLPESPSQLIEKIKNKNYNEAIKARLNLKIIPVIEAENPKDTKLVIIRVNSLNPGEARKVLEELDNVILEEHQKKFDIQKNILLDDKKRIENKISSLETEKKILEEKVDYFIKLQAEEPSLQTQIFLTETKEVLEKKKSEIEEEYINLNSLQSKLGSYEPTHIVKAVTLSETSGAISIKLILAGIFGLFAGVFIAFLQDFFEKNKQRLFPSGEKK